MYYVHYQRRSGHNVSVWAGLAMNDTPDISLIIANDLVFVNDSAAAWLMFKPNLTNSIWVPLKKVDWSWAGNVRRIAGNPDNAWEVVPNTLSYPAPTAATTTTFPVWSRNQKANTFQCQN
jgi:hypothetical protein